MNCWNCPPVIKCRFQIWYGFLCFIYIYGRVPDDFHSKRLHVLKKVDKMVSRWKRKILRIEKESEVFLIFARNTPVDLYMGATFFFSLSFLARIYGTVDFLFIIIYKGDFASPFLSFSQQLPFLLLLLLTQDLSFFFLPCPPPYCLGNIRRRGCWTCR